MQEQDVQPQKAKDKDVQQVFVCTQFINTIKLIYSQDDYKVLKPLVQINSQANNPSNAQILKDITPFHFRQLSIQFFYLLYSCSHKKIVPVPDDKVKFISYSFDTGSVVLCLTQFLTFQTSIIRNYQSQTPYFQYYKTFISAIHPFWKQSQQRSQQLTKRQALTSDYFTKKLNQLAQKDIFKTQKQAFNTFQRQQMFIETSILLRIRNSSLICVIRKSQELIQTYKKHRQIENQLSQQYNDRRRRKNNIEKIFQTQKAIEKNIQEFFLSFKTNPKHFKVEDKRKRQSSGAINNKLTLGLKVYELIDMRMKNQNKNTMQAEDNQNNSQIDEDYYNIYEVQYCSAKNVIIVRMITDLILDWTTSDSILFKWNTLTFQTSNVGLETVEKLDQNKKPKKFVVIRGTSYFNKKEPVLQKMLTLIDITMATFKSIQLQMKSQTMFLKNLSKIDESYKKINHYLRAIHKCCIKSYAAIMAEGD